VNLLYLVYFFNNEISFLILFQYKPKVIIMLNLVLPFVRIMNIMIINQLIKSIKECMDIKVSFNHLKYTKTYFPFDMKQNVEI